MESDGWQWQNLPSDIFTYVLEILLQERSSPALTYSTLSSVCSSWRTALKHHCQNLSTISGGSSPIRHPWRSVKLLNLAMCRPKFSGTVAPLYPLALTKPEADALSPRSLPLQFPSLSVLTLDGQALPKGFLRALPTSLSSIILQGCSLFVHDLLEVLPVMMGLRSLDLGGVFPLDLNSPTDAFSKHRHFTAPPSSLLTDAAFHAHALPLVHVRPELDPAVLPLLMHAPDAQLPQSLETTGRLLRVLAKLPCLHTLDLSMFPVLVSTQAPSRRPIPTKVAFTGLPIMTQCTLLPALSSLKCLRLANNRMTADDAIAGIGRCTNLQELSMAWVAGSNYIAQQLVLTSQVWQECIQSLTGLQSLHLQMYGTAREGADMSLHHQSHLRTLCIAGCYSVPLALSVLKLQSVRTLRLVHSTQLSPELIVQLADNLPELQELDISFTKQRMRVELFGDTVVRGLCHVRPTLRSLRMEGVPFSGSGFNNAIKTLTGTSSSLQGECPIGLQSLHVVGGGMMMQKYRDISSLTQLRSLTFSSVTIQQLTAAARVACQSLSRLTSLTELRILSTRRCSMPWLLQPANPLPNAQEEAHSLHFVASLPVLPRSQELGWGSGQGSNASAAGPAQAQAQGPAHAQAQAQAAQLQPGAVGGGWAHGMDVDAEGNDEGDQGLQGEGVFGMPLGAGPALHQQQQQQQLLPAAHQQLMFHVEEATAAVAALGEHYFALAQNAPLQALQQQQQQLQVQAQQQQQPQQQHPGFQILPANVHHQPGQATVLTAVTQTQAKLREPHLQFLSTMLHLKVLVLESIYSNGTCLSHLPGQDLRVLSLQGVFNWSRLGLDTFRQLSLPHLESLSIHTCYWVPPSSASTSKRNTHPAYMRARPSTSSSITTPPLLLIGDLLGCIASVVPHLESLSVGGCAGLTDGALRDLAERMSCLRYLQLASVPPAWAGAHANAAASHALSAATELRFVRFSGAAHLDVEGGLTLVRRNNGLLPMHAAMPA